MNNDNNTTPPKEKPGDIIADKAGDKPSSEGNKSSKDTDYKALYETEQKKFKDTQKAYTQGQQKISVLSKENKVLADAAEQTIQLTSEQVNELEVLKFKDPDLWFEKKLEFSNAARADLLETRSKAHEEGIEEAAEATKQETISTFLETNSDLTIDMINLDVPKRIHQELDSRKISLEEFLEKSKEYILNGNKVLKDPKDPDLKDLNKVPGGDSPSQEAIKGEIEKQAQTEIY